MFQTETLACQDQFFTQQQLEQITAGNDCHIDDPELLGSKKNLQGKFSPLQVINAIKGKAPEYGIEILQSEDKNPEDQKTMLFSCLVKLTTSKITGHATESTKKQAQ